MKEKECREGTIIGGVVRYKVIENECKKQKQDAEKRQKERSSYRCQTRKAINILIIVKNSIEKHPQNGYQKNSNAKFRVSQNGKITRRAAFNDPLTPQKKARPSNHCRKKIGDSVDSGIYAALSSHLCNLDFGVLFSANAKI